MIDRGIDTDIIPPQPSRQAQEQEMRVVSGIRWKLRDFIFETDEDCYEYLLERETPLESMIITPSLSKASLETLKYVSNLHSRSKSEGSKEDLDVDLSLTFLELVSRLLCGIREKRFESQAEHVLHSILAHFHHDLGKLLKLTKILLEEPVDKNMVLLSMVYNWMLSPVQGGRGNGGGTHPKWDSKDVFRFNEEDGGNSLTRVAELYVKNFLMGKLPKEQWILRKVSKTLLSHIGNGNGGSIIFSGISKALLRSPETTIEAVGYSLEGLKPQPKISVEQWRELAKKIAPFLGSDNEKLKSQAYFTSHALFNVLFLEDDSFVVEAVLIECFELVSPSARGTKSVLSSGGKISFLRLIKSLTFSFHAQCIPFVIEKCLKVLETDVHEGTLLECLDVIGTLSKQLEKNFSANSLLKYIKNGLETFKAPLRLGLCRMMVQIFEDDDRFHSYLHEIKDLLITCVEKALAHPTFLNNLTEAISWSVVLLCGVGLFRYELSDGILSQMAMIGGSHINETFLSSCSPWVLSHVAFLLELLIKNNKIGGGGRISISTSNYYDNFALSLWSCSDRENRLKINRILKRILINNYSPIDTALGMLKSLHNKAILKKTDENSIEEDSSTPKLKEEIIISFAEALTASMNKENLKFLALELLLPCHEFASRKQDFWEFCLKKKMRISAEELLESEQVREDLVKNYLEGFDPNSEANGRVLRTLFRVEKKGRLIRKAVEVAKGLLKDPKYFTVSKEEYLIFLTPKGQLYNQSVLESSGERGGGDYQQKLEEIQLRKELEEKRKAEGKEVQVNYTKKQMEAMKTQLEKESEIRSQVQELDLKIKAGIRILKEALEGDLENFQVYIKDFIEELIPLMKSPVGATPAKDLFIQVGKSLFSTKWFGEAVAQACLRLINPDCKLDKSWGEISPEKNVHYVLERMRDEKKVEISQCSAALSFSYPFFEMALQHFPKDCFILSSILQIITNFSSEMKNNEDSIPRAKITSLLYKILENNLTLGSSHLQKLACNALISFCKTFRTETSSEIDPSELRCHLTSLKSPVNLSREASLSCLLIFIENNFDFPSSSFEDELILLLGGSVYRSQFDPVARVAELGKKLREIVVESLPLETEELCSILRQDILHSSEAVRISSSKSFSFLLSHDKKAVENLVQYLIQKYEENYELVAPIVDPLGRILEEGKDNWEARAGVGLAVKQIACLLTSQLSASKKSTQISQSPAESTMWWIVTRGIGDRSQIVHGIMLDAALELVRSHGLLLNNFIEIVEQVLEKEDKISGRFDKKREAAVILMGSLAKHMDLSDKRTKGIFTTLLETLSTPSEKVQEAVANCLPELAYSIKEDAEEILGSLIEKMMNASDFGVRRGAAYGLAGVIKGLGILSLKRYEILSKLEAGLQDKKDFKKREGALMGFELLCSFLGRLFEPYVVVVLPHLLLCLGDPNGYVREATENTAKIVMSHLSGHGVKLVLPVLTEALNDQEGGGGGGGGSSWRTKVGAVELLGRMAYCAPKQLSSCLPTIVPKLIEVLLGDSHVKVQEAGAKALQLIGSVIQNPEVKSIVPDILEALEKPGKRAGTCLKSLLEMEFIHIVDPPSLALIMPVVERAFGDRSAEIRRNAAQIIGNLYSVTEIGALGPYMESVMPGIKASLLDSLPEVRAVAAKALKAMAKGMGEGKCYEELLPWLISTLVSEEVTGVDRSGAAQGLAEVLGGLGEETVDKFIKEFIRKAGGEEDEEELQPFVRDGYIMMFIYLPGVVEPEVFGRYIGLIIPPILKALADEVEYVRETALLAAQRIVTTFSEKAIHLLLPELEKGVSSPNWRVRHASILILGDLLFKILGVSGKMSTESGNEDDNFGTEQSGKLIKAALGDERRNRVLAALYMGRSDVALLVRVASLHVWKVVVANTPRTLKEIMGTLISLVLACFSGGRKGGERRQTAERTLKDLVRKLGEKILGEIIPILGEGLELNPEGVCKGLREILETCGRDTIVGVLDGVVRILKRVLCDSQLGVRKAAAECFATLHSAVGSKAVEEIVPFLMKKVRMGVGNEAQGEGDKVLDALAQLLIVKEKAVMPYLIPQLTVNTKALAYLAEVAGYAISKNLGKILPFVLKGLENQDEDEERMKIELENCSRIILTISEHAAVCFLVEELLSSANHEGGRAAVLLLSVFCIHSMADLEPHFGQLLKGLIGLMTGTDEAILILVANSVEALVRKVEDKLNHVADIREGISYVLSISKEKKLLPGLCLPKRGILPLLPIYREAILKGGPEMKEQAVLGILELITLSSEEALKPSVIQVTGPLIRILGDRYGPPLKEAVLDTLTLLLEKVGVALKPFVPQLQTTFLKQATEESKYSNSTVKVKVKAAHALAQLVKIHGKPEQIFLEIVTNLKNHLDGNEEDVNDEIKIKDTLLYTLRCVVESGGSKIGEGTRRSILAASYPHLSAVKRRTRLIAGGTVGALIGGLADPDFLAAMTFILADENVTLRVARTSAMVVALKLSPERLYENGEGKFWERILQTTLALLSSENGELVSNGIRACAYIFSFCVKNEVPLPPFLIQPFSKTINNSGNEVKILFGQASQIFLRNIGLIPFPKEVARYLIPALVNGSKDKDSGVRSSCEEALFWMLRVRDEEKGKVTNLDFLDAGGQAALNEDMNKMKPGSLIETEMKELDFDDTILKT